MFLLQTETEKRILAKRKIGTKIGNRTRKSVRVDFNGTILVQRLLRAISFFYNGYHHGRDTSILHNPVTFFVSCMV